MKNFNRADFENALDYQQAMQDMARHEKPCSVDYDTRQGYEIAAEVYDNNNWFGLV